MSPSIDSWILTLEYPEGITQEEKAKLTKEIAREHHHAKILNFVLGIVLGMAYMGVVFL